MLFDKNCNGRPLPKPKSKATAFSISERGVRVCLFLLTNTFFLHFLRAFIKLGASRRHFAKPKHNYVWIVTVKNIQLT